MRSWFDSHAALHTGLSWLLLGLVLVAALAPALASLRSDESVRRAQRVVPSWAFLALLGLTLLFVRWPIFLLADELNPDESQLIAGALTLQRDWFYWSVVDGTTHGPMAVYPLSLAHLCGLPLDYLGARIVGTLAFFSGLVAVFFVLRRAAGDALARVGLLPAGIFLMLATFWDLVHFSSEHIPAALLMIGAALLMLDRESSAPRALSARWIGGGVLLGLVPLAKLQGGPVTAALLVIFAALELLRSTGGWRVRLARVGSLAGAALLGPLCFLLVTLLRGAGPDVWASYGLQNLIYAATRHHEPAEMLLRFWDFTRIAPEFHPYALAGALFLVATLLRLPALPGPLRRQAAVALVMLAASLLVVITPGRQYTHYLLWLVLPLGWAVAVLLAGWWELESRLRRLWLLAVFVGGLIAPQIVTRTSMDHPYLGRLAASVERSRVVDEISRYARPGEALGIWGWHSRLYVKAQLVQATREAHSYLQTAHNPQFDYYRARYLREFVACRPPVFVDAVGPGNFIFEDRTLAHESFGALAEVIAREYRLVGDVDGSRIYVRVDRLPNGQL